MKKILILCLFIISICFTQTGMITPKGEEGFGVWFHAAAYNIEYDDANPEFDLSFGYMMDNVIEVGLDYKLDNGVEGLDWNPITAKIIYHDKSPSGGGFAFGAMIFNVTEADAEDDYWIYETESINFLGFGGYTDDLFSLEGESLSNLFKVGEGI